MNIFKRIFKKKNIANKEVEAAKEATVETQPEPYIEKNYSTWEQDFGFLHMIARQHVTLAISFDVAKLKTTLLDSNLRIKDDDLEKIYNKIIDNIMNSISENYLNMLCKDYFNDVESLRFYIYNMIYPDIFHVATNINIKNSVKAQDTNIKH